VTWTEPAQLLLLIGGISLIPALLFTVTGFSRILIVLGFIRSGLGTPTAAEPGAGRHRARTSRTTSWIPAFIISEPKTAFQIGFLIFLPFLIIDLVVGATLMVGVSEQPPGSTDSRASPSTARPPPGPASGRGAPTSSPGPRARRASRSATAARASAASTMSTHRPSGPAGRSRPPARRNRAI
jgi:hypothetical protein